MRKMMRYGKAYGGADPQLFEGDIFRIIVKAPEFGAAGEEPVTPEVTPEVPPEVTPEVLKMLSVMTGEMTRGEIQDKLGLKDEKHFRESYQQVAVKLGFIEMTIPDKPRSSKQKYRLTEKGRLEFDKRKRGG